MPLPSRTRFPVHVFGLRVESIFILPPVKTHIPGEASRAPERTEHAAVVAVSLLKKEVQNGEKEPTSVVVLGLGQKESRGILWFWLT